MQAHPEGDPFASLNAAQRRAATFAGDSALLVVAGAGTGKTTTLAHRVAHLVLDGVDPRRILLLTFTRRAAAEMSRRAQRVVAAAGMSGVSDIRWAGTFHAIANRLLRLHAPAVGLDPSFTVLDRSDAADLVDLLRGELGLAKTQRRFPKKDTCLAIYSRTVNAQCTLERSLELAFPWCSEWASELRALCKAYVVAKQGRRVLDYDDLLLYWFHAMSAPAVAAEIRARFDHVLVDEYQDTNALQAEILAGLRPDGRGLTVVGDDAQAIYSFRAATVRNILDFPARFDPPAALVALEDNYRSTQPILDAANAVIALAAERHPKELRSREPAQARPILATVDDEHAQVDYVVERILANREAGMALRDQAVLFRTAHHSDALELELGRRRIPFVKFGGLKFLEASHVKDLVCILRWAENPADSLAGFRVLKLLPGVGPAFARRALERLGAASPPSHAALAAITPPSAAQHLWRDALALLGTLADPATPWRGQLGLVRRFYEPLLVELYDAPQARAGDLDQLEHLGAGYPSREAFLSELVLDPPAATGDLAGPPVLDEDWLTLSTIHSAKGQEWNAVFVLQVADGAMPSDLAVGEPEQIEEERRLLYVAMTRAKRELHLVHPLRMYVGRQSRHGDRHVYAPPSRFLPEPVRAHFERVVRSRGLGAIGEPGATREAIDVALRLREMW